MEDTQINDTKITRNVALESGDKDSKNKHDVDEALVPDDGAVLKIEQGIPKTRGLVNLYRQFKTERVLRLKILHSVLISWACLIGGWRQAMIGPTFPDMIQIIKVDVSVGSWLLTAYYIGNITGCLIGGILYDKYSKILVMVGWLLLLAGSAGIVPWCTSFTTMIIAHVIGGASCGAVDVLTITDVLYVWRSQSVYVLQLAQFCYSVGAIVSPLVAAPFLSEKLEQVTPLNDSNASRFDYTNVYNTNAFLNVSAMYNTSGSYVEEHIPGPVYGESNMHVAYLIFASIAFLNASLLILSYAINGNVYRIFVDLTKDVGSRSQTRYTREFSRKSKLFFVCSLTLLLTLHMLIQRMFTSYLLSYLTIKKGWNKIAGSAATSVYWIAVSVSRIIATSVLVYIKLTKAMFMYLSIAITGTLGLFATLFIDTNFLIWMVIAVIGFGLAPLFSGWFTWLSENVVPASGKITSAMFITSVSACSVVPPLLGYLIKNYTYDWLVYIVLIIIPSIFIVFVCVVLTHRSLIKR